MKQNEDMFMQTKDDITTPTDPHQRKFYRSLSRKKENDPKWNVKDTGGNKE